MIKLNDYFDQIYIINLLRRPDKLTKVLWQMNKLNINIKVIEAVDGRQPDIYYKQKKINVGAYGYILSWEKVIQDALNHNYNKILILDDDVIFHHNFTNLFHLWITSIENNNNNKENKWKILLLGATQHTQRPELIENINAYYPQIIDGSFAVGIDKSVYLEIMEGLMKRDKIVDSDILRNIYKKHPLSCYVAYPNLIIADVTSSDIRTGRSQELMAEKLGWTPLSNYNYPPIKPLVSIIISCYNAEKTIVRCLQSMITQTYRPIELIITDDGSHDNTFNLIGQILNKWQYDKRSKDMKIILQRHAINKGCYVARNTGLSNATGDLITFQDADDISLDYRIEEQVNKLLEKRVKFVCCMILRTHLNVLSDNVDQLMLDIQRTRIHNNNYCCRGKIGLVTTMFRKDVIDQLGKYKELKWGADAEYIRRLFPDLDINYQIMNYLNDIEYIPNIYYRISDIMYLSHEMTKDNLTNQRLAKNKLSKLKI